MTAARDADGETTISLAPPASPEVVEPERWNPDREPIDFGFAVTDGAFRVQRTDAGLSLTPLPDHPAFTATLTLDQLGMAGATVATVSADGEETAFTQNGDALTLRCDPSVFSYEVEVSSQ